ncbi:MAG: hypothetical protein ABR910_09070 [Acidobacteriaceae bacterium]
MPRQRSSVLRIAPILALVLVLGVAWGHGLAQTMPPAASAIPAQSVSGSNSKLPEAPDPSALHQRSAQTPEALEASRIASLAQINGRPYQRPTHRDQFDDYLRDSYGWPAFARSTARALYSEARGGPSGWGQDFPGFAQRYGSNVAITAIDGNVRYGMETLFHEDMRYIPCHGCSVKRKIRNALLAEVTARHDSDGHRFFTLTPAIADFSGPIIANAFWYPNHDPFGGVVGTRTVAAARVGGHLFTEFVWERRHHDPKLGD